MRLPRAPLLLVVNLVSVEHRLFACCIELVHRLVLLMPHKDSISNRHTVARQTNALAVVIIFKKPEPESLVQQANLVHNSARQQHTEEGNHVHIQQLVDALGCVFCHTLLRQLVLLGRVFAKVNLGFIPNAVGDRPDDADVGVLPQVPHQPQQPARRHHHITVHHCDVFPLRMPDPHVVASRKPHVLGLMEDPGVAVCGGVLVQLRSHGRAAHAVVDDQDLDRRIVRALQAREQVKQTIIRKAGQHDDAHERQLPIHHRHQVLHSGVPCLRLGP
mmetsp:Transcript_59575/g.98215  ORF Transcript_59575/g.98215 Transcript_59575/m.98215 type:complete len:274 (-) Transcript_59575:1171-1992(-)